MTPAEQSLLLAVFRWSRDGGWVRWADGVESGWTDLVTSVSLTDGGIYVSRDRLDSTQCETNGVAESVDVLVALGILPHRFSTSYRAGWEARRRARGIATCLAVSGDWMGPTRGWSDPEVQALRPAADRDLAVQP